MTEKTLEIITWAISIPVIIFNLALIIDRIISYFKNSRK